MPDIVISAVAVEYRIGEAALVDCMDLEVATGEVVAVLGPNGAGKSTLLGLLAGDLIPTSGTVTIAGANPARTSPGTLALTRAVLTQRLPVDIPFTARDVVAMGRFPHRTEAGNTGARDEEAVAGAMDRTDTLRFADRVYATLSAGERTRVSLARVLAQDTPIVLLDEPTTSLDLANQHRILRVMRRLAGDDKAVVGVMHDLNAAARYADRLVLMDRGRAVAAGGADEVLRADLLSAVYGEPVRVVPHPFHGGPLVLPASD